MRTIVFGLVKFQQFVLGRSLQVFTDHKPPVHIVGKSVDALPARVQRWLLTLPPYDYQPNFTFENTMCANDDCLMLHCLRLWLLPKKAVHGASSLVLEESPVSNADLQSATPEDPLLAGIATRITTSIQRTRWRLHDNNEHSTYVRKEHSRNNTRKMTVKQQLKTTNESNSNNRSVNFVVKVKYWYAVPSLRTVIISSVTNHQYTHYSICVRC